MYIASVLTELGIRYKWLQYARAWLNDTSSTMEVDGKVRFPLLNTGASFGHTFGRTVWRTTSFTKFILWWQRTVVPDAFNSSPFPPIDTKELQAVQDALIEYTQKLASGYDFNVVRGMEVIEAYKTGPSSCMVRNSRRTRFYAQNPEKVGLVKIIKDGKYVGRALIWTLDSGKTLIDRGYPNNSPATRALRFWASQQGYLTLSNDSLGGGKSLGAEESVTLKHSTNGYMPYLDTLRVAVNSEQTHDKLVLRADSVRGQLFTYPGDLDRPSSLYLRDTVDVNNNFVFTWERYSVVGSSRNKTIVVTERTKDDVFKLYSMDGTMHIISKNKLIEIDGKFFSKRQVRKVRGQDGYRVKADTKTCWIRKVEQKEGFLTGWSYQFTTTDNSLTIAKLQEVPYDAQ